MGLGLSIVKNVVDELDSTIEIVSVPLIPEGTEVKITLKELVLPTQLMALAPE